MPDEILPGAMRAEHELREAGFLDEEDDGAHWPARIIQLKSGLAEAAEALENIASGLFGPVSCREFAAAALAKIKEAR